MTTKTTPPATILFADAAVAAVESSKTLPAKFQRMLNQLKLADRVKDKRVGIKMHFGGGIGFTTVHPLFLRILVKALRDAGAKSVKAMDGNPDDGVARGYVKEVVGCDIVSTFGASGKYLQREPIGFKTLNEALYGGEAVDCDFFIDFSHLKAHGACGFGGALKNIAMGCVPGETRGKIHQLEGGITFDKSKCKYCKKCFKECPHNAVGVNDENKEISFFFHNCNYCQHCILVCPQKALTMHDRRFHDFAQGMALVTAHFLRKFKPENLLFLNFLMNITVYCDCWGMSTPSLVQDIGILASDDIAAIDRASLDLIDKEPMLSRGLPAGRELVLGKHLFERIHGKDPYLMVDLLRQEYGGAEEYLLQEVK